MKPLILLTAGLGTARGMVRRELFQNYADSIYEAGGQPVLALGADEELTEKADGLFLTGGLDIEPCRYGKERAAWCDVSDLRRDEEELKLFEWFLKQKKPVFGVCRGLQLINTALGGTLWQDQKEECGVDGHRDGVIHEVETKEGSVLNRLFGCKFLVNSFHHQSVKDLGKGLVITARAGSIVEGFEHESLPVTAVQWHPERMPADMAPLFRWFVEACGNPKNYGQKMGTKS